MEKNNKEKSEGLLRYEEFVRKHQNIFKKLAKDAKKGKRKTKK